jgi:hypothetical protein
MTMNLTNRRLCVTEQVGPFAVSVGFVQDAHGEWTIPCEVWVNARGKSGTELDGHLYEIGVLVSKLIQGET